LILTLFSDDISTATFECRRMRLEDVHKWGQRMWMELVVAYFKVGLL